MTSYLDAARDGSSVLKDGFAELADSLSRVQGGAADFWQGGAADAASLALAPMIKSAQDNSTNLHNATQTLIAQGSHFVHVRDSVREVAKDRPNDHDIASYMPFGASDSEKAAAKWDADTRHNVDTYEPYYQATQANNARMPVTYPEVHSSSVSSAPPETSTPGSTVDSRGVTGFGVGGDTGRRMSSGPGSSSRSGPQQQQAAWQPPAPRPPSPNRSPTEATTPGGYTPPRRGSGSDVGFGPGSGGFDPGSGGFGPTGGADSGMAGGFGPLGGGGYPVGGPGGSSGGGGGRASGVGGAAGELGQGKGTGAGMPGRPGGAGYGGATANAAAGGGRGMPGTPGMGGMGPGGGKGAGAEDSEHQRKIMVSGGDPDSVFGDDLPKHVPPVIGA